MAKLEETTCPRCDGRMVSRTNTKNGQRFWGCAKYPRCHGTRNTDGEVSTRENSHRRSLAFKHDPDAADDIDGPPSERARGNDRRRWDRD